MSKYRVLGFKPQLRLEWRGQDGQDETEQPDHSASLGDSVMSSTRIGFLVHTAIVFGWVPNLTCLFLPPDERSWPSRTQKRQSFGFGSRSGAVTNIQASTST